MSQLPTAQKNRLEAWAARAIEQGWLADDASSALDSAIRANPGQLFEQTNRPLVAGFFGGTGVGKSTLLNRFAAEPVARASAERPTSRNITVYVHRSVSVDSLPEYLPMDRMRTALHSNNDYRQVMFIDMPDFDSVEQSNRQLVDLWLPHLDVVMYVVSPERYRDDQGWQLLRQHASEHAWLFIINQWDRGSEEQLSDFKVQLKSQGLSDPLVFCTDCADPAHEPGADLTQASDDFPQLQSTLSSLSNAQIIADLQEHGVVSRLQSLKSISDTWLQLLAEKNHGSTLSSAWTSHCDKQHPILLDALQWPMTQLAQQYADNTPFWKRLFGRHSAPARTEVTALDAVSQTLNERLTLVLEHYLNRQAHESAIPLPALRMALEPPHNECLATSKETLENALNRSLMHPGGRWQRKLYALTNALCLILPLAALGWISFRVVSGFASGASDPGAYLGSDFAINGILLLGISWLLPALAHTKLKPSHQQAAINGMQDGVNTVLTNIAAAITDALYSLASQATQLRDDYHRLWTELPDDRAATLPDSVKRLLSSQISQSAERRLDVRANTHKSTDSAPLS